MYSYTLRVKYCLLGNTDKHGDDAKIQKLYPDEFNIYEAYLRMISSQK